MSCYREYFKYEIIYFDFAKIIFYGPFSFRTPCEPVCLCELWDRGCLRQSRQLWSCFDVDLGSISSFCWLLVLVAGAAAPPVIRLSLWLSRCAPRLRTGASWRGRAWTGPGDRRSWTLGACCGPGVIRFSRVCRSPPSHVGRTAHHSPALVREVNMKRQMSYK